MSKKPERLGQSVMVPDGYVTREDVILLRADVIPSCKYNAWKPEEVARLESLAARIEALLPSVAR